VQDKGSTACEGRTAQLFRAEAIVEVAARAAKRTLGATGSERKRTSQKQRIKPRRRVRCTWPLYLATCGVQSGFVALSAGRCAAFPRRERWS